jgi:hypothetical protein
MAARAFLAGASARLYKQLVVVSSGVVEALAGMNRGKQLPFAVDCRTTDKDGYRQLYSILLAYFVFQFSLLNPSLQKELLESLPFICGESEEQRQLLARLGQVQALLPKANRSQPDLMKLGSEAWQQLKPVLKARNEPLDGAQFTVFTGSLFNASLRKLQTFVEGKTHSFN